MTNVGSSWVHEGYNTWLASLDDACGFSHGDESPGETTVVLVGLTQDGKTTLALRLLDSQEPEQMGDALRGGRARGQSATPGPIAYKAVSASDRPDYAAIENSIAKSFENYRTKYESWQNCQDQAHPFEVPPVVEIPSISYDAHRHLTIVDMAGFDGRESWAEHAAEYWTARADYTILVIRAEYIDQLRGERFASIWPRLVNRWIHSESLFVVTTRAFEGKLDPREKTLDWDGIRENRLIEFHKILSSTAIKQSQVKIFPMSFPIKDTESSSRIKVFTEMSVNSLKDQLKSESILTRFSNAEVLRLDREESLAGKKQNMIRQRLEIATQLDEIRARLNVVLELENEFSEGEVPNYAVSVYNIRRVPTGCDSHRSYSMQEPKNAFHHYEAFLAEFHKTLKEHLSVFVQKAQKFLPERVFSPIAKDIEFDGLPSHLEHKIREDFYETNSLWIFYSSEKSGRKLHDVMVSRNRSMRDEVESLAESAEEKVASRLRQFLDKIIAFGKDLDRKKEEFEDKIKTIDDDIHGIDIQKATLPKIPDLVERMLDAFIIEWNKTIQETFSAAKDTIAVTNSFLHIWAMKEWLEKITVRVGRANQNGIGTVERTSNG